MHTQALRGSAAIALLASAATALSLALAPNGVAIVSGLLESQQRQVLNAHRACGLVLTNREVRDGWATLTMSKPARRPIRAGPAECVERARGRSGSA